MALAGPVRHSRAHGPTGRPRLNRQLATARAGARPRPRGLRPLQGRRRGRERRVLPGAGPGAAGAVRDLRRRDGRHRLRHRGRGRAAHHHERVQAVRLRPGLPGPGGRSGARPPGRQQHRPAVRFGHGHRLAARRTDESDGQPGSHRHHRPRPRAVGGRALALHRLRSRPLRRPRPDRERRRLRLGGGEQRAQPGNRPPAGEVSAGSPPRPRRRSTSTPGSARSKSPPAIWR